MNRRRFITAGLGASLIAPPSCSPQQQKVRIACASNFAETLHSLRSDIPVSYQVIVGSSGQLHSQIIAGAPFDLFLSADRARPEDLASRGLAEEIFHYTTGRLALFSPAGLGKPRSFPKKIDRVAIANPRHAPYGVAAEEALAVFESNAEIITASNVVHAFQMAHSGAVPAAFVSVAQLLAADMSSETYLRIESESISPIEQYAAVLRPENPSIIILVEHLQSAPIRARLTSLGYA